MADPKQTAVRTLSAAAKAEHMDASNKRVLKAIVFPDVTVRKDSDMGGGGGESKELPVDDILSTLSADGKIIEPPFDLLVLAMLQEHSTDLQPIIEAMEINIDGFGHKLVNRFLMDTNDSNDDDEAEPVRKERIQFTNFLSHCALDETFVSLRRRARHDLESIGNSYWEVIRSPLTNVIQGFNHIPGYQVRLGRADEEQTKYDKNVVEIGEDKDETPHMNVLHISKRFRKYVQAKVGFTARNFASTRGYKLRWFKEYRDPRVMDFDTGDCFPPDTTEAKTLIAKGKAASELIHFKLYSPRTPYGLPRYIGNLLTIFGDRAAQEINFITLKNNNIPSMAVMVSNGQLTEGTITRIEEFVNSQIQGSENYSRILLLEGEGALEGEDTGAVKIDIKPLTSEQMRDQMFQKYQENNSDKLRRSYRLPPIFLGITGDFSAGTAESSRRLADEQVFKPERDEFDTLMNDILADMGCLYHVFQSKGADITGGELLIKVLMTAERCGGLTPRIAREIMTDILGRRLPPINPTKLDPDIPFSIQLAEKAKNEAFMETGSPEVGSQVTALKSLGGLTAEQLVGALVLHRDVLEERLENSILFGEGEPVHVKKAKPLDEQES